MSWYDVDELWPGVVRVNDGDLDTSYVLMGSERTAVIDTGMGIGDLASLVAGLSTVSPVVINTHAHPDHVGGNYQFDEYWIGAEEWQAAQRQREQGRGHHRGAHGESRSPIELMQPKRPLPPEFDPAQYQPNRWSEPGRLLNEGEIIDLGGFRLEVIVAPAHTHGSICLLDRERRMLLTGDTIHDMVVWLHLEGCPAPEVAYRTYERLAGYADVVDYVLPAHGTRVCSSSLLTGAFAGVQRIWAGEIEPVYAQTFAGDGWRYDLGVCQLLFKERIVPA